MQINRFKHALLASLVSTICLLTLLSAGVVLASARASQPTSAQAASAAVPEYIPSPAVPTDTITLMDNGVSPIAWDDQFSGTEDTTFNSSPRSVLENDELHGNVLRALLTEGPFHGSLILKTAEGTFGYVPVPDFFGTDVFTYTLSNAEGHSDMALVTITINPVNDMPALDALGNLTIRNAAAMTVTLSGISYGPANENQTITITAASSNPALMDNPTVSYASPAVTGTLTLHPTSQMTGTARISVFVNDGEATVERSFLVAVPNSAPFFTSTPLLAVVSGHRYSYTITAADLQKDDTLTIKAVSPLPASLALEDNGDGTATLSGQPVEIGDHVIRLQIEDNNGAKSELQEFTLSVAPNYALLPMLLIHEER